MSRSSTSNSGARRRTSAPTSARGSRSAWAGAIARCRGGFRAGPVASGLLPRGRAPLSLRALAASPWAPPGGRLRTPVLAYLAVALVWAITPPPLTAQLVPDEDWRTLETARFRVHFPLELEAVARRAAGAAERAYDRLAPKLKLATAPDSPIDLVVSDHVDVSNGYTMVAPHRRIVVYARPPVDGFGLSFFDDWLELAIIHELAHVLHLDQAGALGRVFRALFGRVPALWPFFPHQGGPRWLSEGVAAYYESALTGAGRGRGTYTEMMLRTAALEGALEPIDRASGSSSQWPGGERPYAYGTEFLDWLLARHGPDRLAVFVDALAADPLPFRIDAAAREAFGRSFSEEWEAWSGELQGSARILGSQLRARAPLTDTDSLTRGARLALYPQAGPNGRLGYAWLDGIRQSAPDGSGARRLVRTNGAAVFSWLPYGGIVFSQIERSGPYRLYNDLYVAGPDGEGVRRITHGARIDHPSASPSGRQVAAIRYGGGTTELVWVDLVTGQVDTIVPPAPDVHWAFPALSPDGRWVAASRWREGAWDVVVVDPRGAVVSATRDRAVDLRPAWSPDGRSLVWTSDRTGIWNLMGTGFNPLIGNVGPVRQVTNLTTGAAFPSIDAGGRWIYMSVYHADGWDVERIPFEPTSWFRPFPTDLRFQTPPSRPAPPVDSAAAPTGPYRALSTLAPGFWLPVVDIGKRIYLPGRDDVWLLEPGVGLLTYGQDAVGRHTVSLAAVFSATGGRMEGGVGYRYTGLGNPVLSLSADQVWNGRGPLLRPAEPPSVDTLFIRQRERRLTLGAQILGRRFRTNGGVGVFASVVENRRVLLDRDLEESTEYRLLTPTNRLGEVRAVTSLSTSRARPLSISSEEGLVLILQARARRELALADSLAGRLGVDRSYDDAIASSSAFVPLRTLGLGRHVLAFHVTAGTARGPGADRFHFELGGARGLYNPLLGTGRGYLEFPVRGYERGERRGRHAWSARAEYRFPLARVNRGVGLFPAHLDQTSGALFADAGNAWGPELGEDQPRFANPRGPTLASVGAELSTDILLFFTTPLRLRAGVALPLVAGTRPRAPGVYVRFRAVLLRGLQEPV